MVSWSRILNPSLLLVPQSVYQDVSTPQQASVEQYNVIKYLGGSAPYIQREGYGISTDFPNTCSIEQVQMISRHGERFPSKGDGVAFEKVLTKFQNYGEFKGDLSFLNTYQYFVTDSDYYEKETSPENSKGPYAGTTNAFRHGLYFANRYKDLFNGETLPVFTSNSGRCFQTANFFARGLLGDDYDDGAGAAGADGAGGGTKVKYVVIDEDPKMGANSLTPRYACKNLDNNANLDLIASYDKTYLQDILTRWQVDNPSLDLTLDEVSSLFLWCAFELNVRGQSPFCLLFTNDEFIKSGYRNDIVNYYQIGQGNNLSTTVGSPMVEASLKLLQEESDTKTWLFFTHDTDMEFYLSSMGLINPESDIPVDHVPFPNPYNAAEQFPQAARTYLEKFDCGGQKYIRFIMNDAVVPFPGCSSGPAFMCALDEFVSIVSDRMSKVSFQEQCNASGPLQLTFFWDYKQQEYNAPLIDQ